MFLVGCLHSVSVICFKRFVTSVLERYLLTYLKCLAVISAGEVGDECGSCLLTVVTVHVSLHWVFKSPHNSTLLITVGGPSYLINLLSRFNGG